MAYASKYYDPVKAHEYYMQTRELKGYENRYGGSRGDGTSAASTPGYMSDAARNASGNGGSRVLGSSDVTTTAPVSSSSSSNQDKSPIAQEIDKLRQEIKTLTNDTRKNNAAFRNQLKNMSKEDRAANRDSFKEAIEYNKALLKQQKEELQNRIKQLQQQQKDEKQRERDAKQRESQMKKGGSTAGFNQKGKEAAEYIKNQMEKERDEVIKKSNKDADNQMLDEVKKLADDIKAMRESGRGFSHAQFRSKIKSALGRTKKAKLKARRKHMTEYKQKYQDEIDKLRQDDSMYTYWDKRNHSSFAIVGPGTSGSSAGSVLGSSNANSSGKKLESKATSSSDSTSTRLGSKTTKGRKLGSK